MRLLVVLSVLFTLSSSVSAQHFATGIKIGEVDQTSAIVWTRLTRNESANFDLLNPKLKQLMPIDVAPGMAGEVMLSFVSEPALEGSSMVRILDWEKVGAENDFTHQFKLSGLNPNSKYRVRVSSREAGSEDLVDQCRGTFRTAPAVDSTVPVRFIVSTCQAVRSVDSGPDGHAAYQKMLAFDPHFFVHTGDIVYYDKLPLAKTVEQARAKWNLMFGYGHNKRFHQQVSSYFMKDDHDTLKNDCWPGQKYGKITFDEGLDIFREQVPMGDRTYRTFRWGKDVQIWMTENRDFRSANTMKDSPEKTILGEQQKKWLMDSIVASDATYKFVISPGPIVGPDKKGKSDNHANDAFAHEGRQLRDFLSKQKNTFVICGDRHWQYCSRDPKTGLVELGCGPINDQHNFGGDPGRNAKFHRYFSNKGGFLSVTVADGAAKAHWYGVNSKTGTILPDAKILHEELLGE